MSTRLVSQHPARSTQGGAIEGKRTLFEQHRRSWAMTAIHAQATLTGSIESGVDHRDDPAAKHKKKQQRTTTIAIRQKQSAIFPESYCVKKDLGPKLLLSQNGYRVLCVVQRRLLCAWVTVDAHLFSGRGTECGRVSAQHSTRQPHQQSSRRGMRTRRRWERLKSSFTLLCCHLWRKAVWLESSSVRNFTRHDAHG